MAKTMQIKYAGKEYVLEFTRASVRKMFRDGFDIENVTKDPFVVFDLFKYAFLAHSPVFSITNWNYDRYPHLPYRPNTPN